MKLYKRNAKGKPIIWEINRMAMGVEIKTGLVGGNLHKETIQTTKTKVDEYESRIKVKRKEGYKELLELRDNIDITTVKLLESDHTKYDEQIKMNLKLYLETYLPKYSTTSEGFVLPMLAKTLEDNKPFEKYGIFLGQWKINGLRCLIGAEKNGMDLFNPITLTYHSREGQNWTNNMRWMDEIILPKIDTNLLDLMIEEGAYLDGELYLPGYSVNDINSFVKNTALPQHYQLQYWCYDIAVENMSADKRRDLLTNSIKRMVRFVDKESHLNNNNQFILLPSYHIFNINNAIEQRDRFINLGFEGLIIRNPTTEYQFGKRNQSMFKFKKIDDGLFEIVDIKQDKRGLPIFILRNDINEEQFECTYNAPHDEQERYISTPLKEELIKNYNAFVEYRERSGVKQVPFHSKIIRFESK